MTTKINKKIGHDSMSISGVMQSGANVKFTINRGGEKIVAGLSNDIKIAKVQLLTLQTWLKLRDGENNAQRFDRLENVLKISNNSKEFIENLK
ncbi:MAG: hypothetical protein WC979_00420 [Candidatus Pacearchaeota archaeon]|jgi:predicted secreted acid phosphatase|nr:hypothetical protein [Clostridia bacterium]